MMLVRFGIFTKIDYEHRNWVVRTICSLYKLEFTIFSGTSFNIDGLEILLVEILLGDINLLVERKKVTINYQLVELVIIIMKLVGPENLQIFLFFPTYQDHTK